MSWYPFFNLSTPRMSFSFWYRESNSFSTSLYPNRQSFIACLFKSFTSFPITSAWNSSFFYLILSFYFSNSEKSLSNLASFSLNSGIPNYFMTSGSLISSTILSIFLTNSAWCNFFVLILSSSSLRPSSKLLDFLSKKFWSISIFIISWSCEFEVS